MVGVIPSVSKVDLDDSRSFLAQLGVGSAPGLRIVVSAMDGGVGIGRVTQALLLDVIQQVDIVEPVSKFTETLYVPS
ncbi:hypothetical protein FHL15_000836 [Xylaria flabelliformis]|uniref:Alpha N-terminal protein methyltransferase 1 n=1 Tax=Xylaria flabelliformis TaxID=2512241 RepID=A0A553IDD1_9PEZI|nr:hypothetical protein FHL15_000836 [Xylaria flabelliformis]